MIFFLLLSLPIRNVLVRKTIWMDLVFLWNCFKGWKLSLSTAKRVNGYFFLRPIWRKRYQNSIPTSVTMSGWIQNILISLFKHLIKGTVDFWSNRKNLTSWFMPDHNLRLKIRLAVPKWVIFIRLFYSTSKSRWQHHASRWGSAVWREICDFLGWKQLPRFI